MTTTDIAAGWILAGGSVGVLGASIIGIATSAYAERRQQRDSIQAEETTRTVGWLQTLAEPDPGEHMDDLELDAWLSDTAAAREQAERQAAALPKPLRNVIPFQRAPHGGLHG